jgi:peptide deformylase
VEVLIWPHPILNERAQEVTDYDDELVQLVDSMFATMYKYSGIGLAANQVGVLRRVLVVDTGTLRQEFINPIIKESHGTHLNKEGCLSFPGVFVTVHRHEHIAVEAQDRNGKTFSVVADGIDAICLQHEIDHLDGITFYDRLSPVKKQLNKKKFEKLKKRRKQHVSSRKIT